MIPRDSFDPIDQFRILKLEQFFATVTVEMVVLGIAVIMFVNAAAIEFKFPEQARIDEFVQGTVNRWPTDVTGATFGRQAIDQLIGIKMFVLGENFPDQRTALFRVSHPATLQIILESLFGRQGNRNRFEPGCCVLRDCVVIEIGHVRRSIDGHKKRELLLFQSQ